MLLNVEGKVFKVVFVKWILGYFVDKRYIKLFLQKVGIIRFFGYVEYISQFIKEVKEGKNNFVVVWLDLINVFGFVVYEGFIIYIRLLVLLLLL